jgi:6-phosphogluconolactonase
MPVVHRALLCLLLLPAPVWSAAVTGWIGTYTSRGNGSSGSVGIYSFQWDSVSGTMSALREAAAVANPSFLTVHPNGRYLYAVNESASPDGGAVTAFAIADSPSEPLRNLGSVPSMGKGPCHVSLNSTGHWLFVANYGSGTIAVYPVQSDGRLGEAVQTIQHQSSGAEDSRSQPPHAHEVVQSPDGRFLLAADLGLDKVFVYRFDSATGKLTPNTPAAASFPPGHGPRHLVFSKDGRKIYVLTELTANLVTLRWDARRGAMTQLFEISTLPAGDGGKPSAAEIVLHPSGKFLYASNRAESNTIAAFRIGPDGTPEFVGSVPSGGKTPRFIGIDPSGRYLMAANQDSDTISLFHINPVSGALTSRGSIAVAAPVDIVFERRRTHGGR